MSVTISENAARWLARGERGLSSEALFTMTVGLDIRGGGILRRGEPRYPYDPDDFQRCERMLRMVPEARENLAVARLTPEWTVLIDHWDELVALMEKEAPGVFDGVRVFGKSAPRTYAWMRELLDGAQKVDGANG